MTTIAEGLADVAHVVEDCPSLSAMVKIVETERLAMITVGRIQLEALRVTAKIFPELGLIVELGERVFGSDK
jgi:hypothetical protein